MEVAIEVVHSIDVFMIWFKAVVQFLMLLGMGLGVIWIGVRWMSRKGKKSIVSDVQRNKEKFTKLHR